MAKKPTYKDLEEKIAALELAVSRHKKRDKSLKKTVRDLQSFLEDSPIAQSEFDGTKLKRYFDSLRVKGVTDFRTFFRENDDAVEACVKRIRLIRTNNAALEVFGTENTFKHRNSTTHHHNTELQQLH